MNTIGMVAVTALAARAPGGLGQHERLAVSRTAADRPMLAPEDEFAESLYCVIFATFLKSFRRPQ
jgi:hypothetical protein